MKILLTLLTSNDLPRLKRLIGSVLGLNLVKEIELKTIIVLNTLNEEYAQEVFSASLPFPIVRTESDGKPGKGKNSCLDLFLETDFDFISQIDGDDFLYPTYLESLYNHISHFPCIDVLGIIPIDYISKGEAAGHRFKIHNGSEVGVWGCSVVSPSKAAGPGLSHVWTEKLPPSSDFIILQSKKSAIIKMHEDIPTGEDHLYTYQLLAEHQKGNLCYFQTMSSDFYVIDRNTESSIQDQYPQKEYVEQLRELSLKYVSKSRSSPRELPIMYKELLLTQYQKEDFIKNITKEYAK